MKKKIVIILLSCILFSCKKEASENKSSTSNVSNKEMFFSIGDTLITQSAFINSISESCAITANNTIKSDCNLSKIKYNYEKFISWKSTDNQEFKKGELTLKLQKSDENNNNASIFSHINLVVFKNNKIVATKTVFIQENYDESLTAISQFFYLNSDLDLFTVNIIQSEEGTKVTSWIQSKIDASTGKIINIKINKILDKKEDISDWNGKYYFEAKNTENIKVSFSITINNLNDIEVVYIGDGVKKETYGSLIADKINPNKIKIIFNERYEQLGEFFLEKSNNNYFITGEVVNKINPNNTIGKLIKR